MIATYFSRDCVGEHEQRVKIAMITLKLCCKSKMCVECIILVLQIAYMDVVDKD